MSFAPPSLQRDYVLCSQYDDALDLPEVPELAEDAPAADRAHVEQLAADRAVRLKVARERGDWPIKQGRNPTRFTFRPVPRHSINWWLGEVGRHKKNDLESLELMFRLAIKEVDNFGSFKAQHEEIDGHRLLTVESLNALYAAGNGLGVKVVFELAEVVAMRASAPPLS